MLAMAKDAVCEAGKPVTGRKKRSKALQAVTLSSSLIFQGPITPSTFSRAHAADFFGIQEESVKIVDWNTGTPEPHQLMSARSPAASPAQVAEKTNKKKSSKASKKSAANQPASAPEAPAQPKKKRVCTDKAVAAEQVLGSGGSSEQPRSAAKARYAAKAATQTTQGDAPATHTAAGVVQPEGPAPQQPRKQRKRLCVGESHLPTKSSEKMKKAHKQAQAAQANAADGADPAEQQSRRESHAAAGSSHRERADVPKEQQHGGHGIGGEQLKADGAGTGPADASKARKRKRGTALGSELAPEEAARRARQRELRELALRVRALGREYDARAHRAMMRKKERTAQPAPAAATTAPAGAVDVVIIPIYWNKHVEDKAAVLAAARKLEAQLRSGSVATAMELSDTLMPGQKFKLWEERGVRLRVELGPRDARAGTAVLAIAHGAPGEVAAKRPVAAGPPLLAAVLEALGRTGNAEPAADIEAAAKSVRMPGAKASRTAAAVAATPAEGTAARPVGKKQGKAGRVAAAALEAGAAVGTGANGGEVAVHGPVACSQAPAVQQGNEHASPAVRQPVAVESGDALGGDFGDAVLEQFEEPGQPKKKKKKKQAALAPDPLPDWAVRKALRRPEKKPKVVSI